MLTSANTHHLILGGARSGKSRYAESIVINKSIEKISENDYEESLSTAYYLATAEALDDEMIARIKRHQQDRQHAQDATQFVWQLIEEPLHLGSAINSLTNTDIILIECLTLWLSNCLHSECWPEQKQLFLQSLQQTKAQVIMVSNEVGQGIAPTNKLSRKFIDETGWLHQELAQICCNVSLITAGLAQQLK